MYPILAGVFGAIAVDYYCFRRPMFKAFEDYNKALESRNVAYREDCERRLRDEKENKRRYGK
jgi:hypothetical protein